MQNVNTVKDILDSKGREVWSIAPSKSVLEAVEFMVEKSVGALTVVDGDKHLVGIISERDAARKVLMKEASPRETWVEDIMTREVFTVNESASVDRCLAQMAGRKIRHLPVMNEDALVGIVAAVDVFKYIIRDQLTTIEELENYVKDETGGSG
ncbi:MAG TPA: CBS domain-containing protein [Pseudomonadales bacterium]|nr:CBS domain-containing protein [Pseudomonadales bacterium]